MPTYVVSTESGRFTPDVKQDVAARITQCHSNATGAPGFFAQVIFNEMPVGNCFIGGSPLKTDHIFVHGYIRGGRTVEQKQKLLNSLVDAIGNAASTEARYVWAYVSDLPPSQMVEYGRILPDPGSEDSWLASMPAVEREHLLTIGKAPLK